MAEIKREFPTEEVGGLDADTDGRDKMVVLRIRAWSGEDPDDVKRERSVAFNAYNLAHHSEVFCVAMSMEYPLNAESDAPCVDNIDFAAMPDDPYSDPRSILPVPESKGEKDPVTVESLRYLANFVNRTLPIEPVGKNFKWFPPHQYMEIVYRSYDSIPELFKYLVDANRLGLHSIANFIGSEIAEQLRTFLAGRKPTVELMNAFKAGEFTPNHDTRRRAWMLEDQSSDREVAAVLAEMKQSEAKRAT